MEQITSDTRQAIPDAPASLVVAVFGPTRPRFLALPPVCVLLGAAAALSATGSLNIWHVALALVGAVSAHMSVNALNEYCDFRSGLDMRTNRTPFSGGTGTLPRQPELAWLALVTGVVTLAITAAVGVYFLIQHGMALLPVGLLGIIVITLYTPYCTRQSLLCLIAPGLGFGTLMVVGTEIALTGQYTSMGLLASFVPFFLVSDLLLLNQFPDVEADTSVGRRHALVTLGKRRCSYIYVAFLAAAYVVIIIGVISRIFPEWALLGLGTVPIAIPTARGALRYYDDIPRLIPFLGMNVVINLATPLLLGIGLLAGR